MNIYSPKLLPEGFYVYAYLREDGTYYYIGKGKGARAHLGNHGKIHAPNDLSRIVVIEQNLTENDAFALEIKLINEYGRKDLSTGILRNLTNGGEGSSGAKHGRPPQERIDKISQALTGRIISNKTKEKMSDSAKKNKSEKWKQSASKNRKGKSISDKQKQFLSESRMGENNPMFGKSSPRKGVQLSEETKLKIREARAKQIISPETRAKMAAAQKLSHAKRRLNINN